MARPGPAAGFDTIRHPQKRAALLAYAETMQVDAAMRSAKISRTHHYYWLKTDPDYKAAFAQAREMAADLLEAEAVRRGRGTAEGHSDTLLIFLLKGAKPDIYKERYEHTGKDGGPIQVASMAPDARQARLAALMAKRNGQAEAVTPEPGEYVMTLADFEALVTRLEREAPRVRAWPHANTAQTEPWVMAIALPEGGYADGVVHLLQQHGFEPLVTRPVPGASPVEVPPLWIILRSDV